MPTLMELQKRLKKSNGIRHSLGSEEVLISDVRAQMRPGDFVAQKLQAALVNGSAVTAPRTRHVPSAAESIAARLPR